MIMTLPFWRLSRPLVASTMSSAWSQGTLCRRRVTFPSTVSDTTILRPLTSASSCSTARVSMSWKFSVSRSPLYFLPGLKSVAFSAAWAVTTGATSTVNTWSDW
jgi:hypothetical protein